MKIAKKYIYLFYTLKKEKIMQINFNPNINNKPAFNAKLKLNSPELKTAFAKEFIASEQKSWSNLRENIIKFKLMFPSDIVEVALKPTGHNTAELEVLNPQTMHIKSFEAVEKGNFMNDTFNRMFEFLTGNSYETKKFWTDDVAKDLFVK